MISSLTASWRVPGGRATGALIWPASSYVAAGWQFLPIIKHTAAVMCDSVGGQAQRHSGQVVMTIAGSRVVRSSSWPAPFHVHVVRKPEPRKIPTIRSVCDNQTKLCTQMNPAPLTACHFHRMCESLPPGGLLPTARPEAQSLVPGLAAPGSRAAAPTRGGHCNSV